MDSSYDCSESDLYSRCSHRWRCLTKEENEPLRLGPSMQMHSFFFCIFSIRLKISAVSPSVVSQSLCRPLSLITRWEQCEQQPLCSCSTPKRHSAAPPPLPCCCKESFSRVTMSAGVFLSRRRRRSAADHFTFDAAVTAASRGRRGGESEEFHTIRPRWFRCLRARCFRHVNIHFTVGTTADADNPARQPARPFGCFAKNNKKFKDLLYRKTKNKKRNK